MEPKLKTVSEVEGVPLSRMMKVRIKGGSTEAWRTFTTDTTKHNSPEFSIQRKTKQIYVMQT